MLKNILLSAVAGVALLLGAGASQAQAGGVALTPGGIHIRSNSGFRLDIGNPYWGYGYRPYYQQYQPYYPNYGRPYNPYGNRYSPYNPYNRYNPYRNPYNRPYDPYRYQRPYNPYSPYGC